jgi:hypothetical protein
LGLTAWLHRLATQRPHVLVVEVPGWQHVRLTLEAELGRRGGVVAESPAAADSLVVVGPPDERFAEVIERAWQQLPGPRTRASVMTVGDVATVLDTLVAGLDDTASHTAEANGRRGFEPEEGDHMAPSGIPLASGADDRDGLEMDVLHLPLGPVLSHWPAGLVVRCTVSGDVVTEVDVERLGAAIDAPAVTATPRLQAAECLDSALRVLALAGSDEQRTRTRGLRDRLALDDEGVGVQDLQHLQEALHHSRVLRWMLRDVGRYDGADAHDRMLAAVADAAAHLTSEAVESDALAPELLTELLPGVELAQVRLVVASLRLEPTTVVSQAPRA